MSQKSKFILGFFTFLPVIYGIIFLVCYLLFIKEIVLHLDTVSDPQVLFKQYFTQILNPSVILFIIAAVITHFSLMIWYIVHVLKTGTKSEGEKVMWILLFIFIGTIANIIYFLVRIVPTPSARPTENIS